MSSNTFINSAANAPAAIAAIKRLQARFTGRTATSVASRKRFASQSFPRSV